MSSLAYHVYEEIARAGLTRRGQNRGKMKTDGNYLVLTTGKRVYAFDNIIGVDINDDFTMEPVIHGGYDDNVYVIKPDDDEEGWSHECITAPEAIEISEAMIEQWTKYRDHLKAQEQG